MSTKKPGRPRKTQARDRELEKLTAAMVGNKSQPARILAAIDGLNIRRVHDAEGAAYLLHDNEVLLVDGVETSNLIALTAKQQCQIVPSPTVVRTVLNMLRAEAADKKVAAVRIYQRWAHVNGVVYYDLGDPKRRVVVITAQGWSVTPAPETILFRRSVGYKEQAEPVLGGTMEELSPLVNLIKDEWILFKALLLSAAQADDLPRPITATSGEHDSGKTSISRIMSELIDPRTVAARGVPKSYRDLLAAMTASFLLVLDNVSWLDVEMCDALCLCATGVGLALPTRTLYTTAGETTIKALRPIVLNGIPDVGTSQPDFLDRLVKLSALTISDAQRIPESVFWARFEEIKPRVLGALFTAVSMALQRKSEVEQERLNLTGVRFIDFVRWTAAAAPALGFTSGDFIKAYRDNRTARDTAALDNSVIYQPLICKLQPIVSHQIESITMADLFEQITETKKMLAQSNFIDRQENWPKTSATFSAALRRIAPPLRKIGISISRKTVRGKDLYDIDAKNYFRDQTEQRQGNSNNTRKNNKPAKNTKNGRPTPDPP